MSFYAEDAVKPNYSYNNLEDITETHTESYNYLPNHYQNMSSPYTQNYSVDSLYNVQTQSEKYFENESGYQISSTSETAKITTQTTILKENVPHILSSQFEQDIGKNNSQVVRNNDNRQTFINQIEASQVKEASQDIDNHSLSYTLDYNASQIINVSENYPKSQVIDDFDNSEDNRINSYVGNYTNYPINSEKVRNKNNQQISISDAQIQTYDQISNSTSKLASKDNEEKNYESETDIVLVKDIQKTAIVPQVLKLTEEDNLNAKKQVGNVSSKSNDSKNIGIYNSTSEPDLLHRSKRQVQQQQQQAATTETAQTTISTVTKQQQTGGEEEDVIIIELTEGQEEQEQEAQQEMPNQGLASFRILSQFQALYTLAQVNVYCSILDASGTSAMEVIFSL